MNIIDKTFAVRFKEIKYRESFRHGVFNYIKCDDNKAFNINTLMMDIFPDSTLVLPIEMTILLTDSNVKLKDINIEKIDNIIEEDDLPL